jgi:hypothetical protein
LGSGEVALRGGGERDRDLARANAPPVVPDDTLVAWAGDGEGVMAEEVLFMMVW